MNPNPSSEQAERASKPMWRVGTKVPQNVYCSDQPVCQCQTKEYAAQIVAAMNAVMSNQAAPPPQPSPREPRIMAANPTASAKDGYLGQPHWEIHTEREGSCEEHGCVPVAPAPPSVPSVYGCDPSEVPIPEGWERVDQEQFREPRLGDWYLSAREDKAICQHPNAEHAGKVYLRGSYDARRIIVRRKPAPSVPSGARRMQGNRVGVLRLYPANSVGMAVHGREHDEHPDCAHLGCVDAQPAPEPAQYKRCGHSGCTRFCSQPEPAPEPAK